MVVVWESDAGNPNILMRILTSIFALLLAFTLVAAEPAALKSAPTAPLPPGTNDVTITKLTAKLFERNHYSHQPMDDAMSERFYSRYLDMLDPLHFYFLQTDLAEFEPYRHTLDELTLQHGDTRPAYAIFMRFLQRMKQHMDYVNELLKTEKFEFNTDEQFVFNRRKLPRPENLQAAKKLWRDYLRFEYLDQKLGAASAKPAATKPGAEKPKTAEAKKKTPAEILTKKYASYWDVLSRYDSDDVLQLYLRALALSFDPHSDYMGKSEMESFEISMKNSLFGIGAQLKSEYGYTEITELVPGSPAQRSKQLKPGDQIVAVAQGDKEPVDTVNMKLGKVVQLIRGDKGTPVRLTIIPADAADPSARKIVSLIREKINLEDRDAKAEVFDLPLDHKPPLRVGVIDLQSFYADMNPTRDTQKKDRKSTTADVARLLKKLVKENVSGIILDLRRNGGGSLEEAINLTGLFIKEGPVVQIKDSNGDITVDRDTDPSIAYDGPLIVLTSRFSASASEILAGALQDYGRALIVGDIATFGKGTVQQIFDLNSFLRPANDAKPRDTLGAVKLTLRKFYRASGSSTQLKGVVPDIILPSINNYAEVGESRQENPLEWDTIQTAKYEPVNRVQPFLNELRQRSEKRLATDKDFTYVREDIELFKKAQADKSVSLNEARRLQEKKEMEAKRDARDKERRARHEAEPKTYELTLKEVDLPGLQVPKPKTDADKEVKASPAPLDDPEDAVDEKAPAIDVPLKEAKRILLDLISLSGGDKSVAVRK